jgi:ATP-dependent protease ClpP protease subunit
MTEKATPLHWRFENVAEPEAELFLFDDIGGDYGVSVKDFQQELAKVRSSRLTIHVHSSGGGIVEGLGLYDTIRQWRGFVTSRVTLAASAASVVALAANRVEITARGSMMIHKTSIASIGGSADDLASASKQMRIFDNCIAGVYCAKSGHDPDHWLALMAAESWFTGAAAVAAGLADAVVDGDRLQPAARVSLGAPILAWRQQRREEVRQLVTTAVREQIAARAVTAAMADMRRGR